MTTPDHPARPSPAPGRRTGPAAVARTLVGVAVAAALVVWGLPWVSGVGWGEIGRVLRAVPPAHAIGFQALMLAALGGYAITLAASLPDLSWPRALVLNLAGSAVSKVAPGGGAVGLAATFGIARSWGHRTEAVATSALVTGVWNLLARIAVPLLALGLLWADGLGLPGSLVGPLRVTSIVLTVVLALLVAALASDRVARALRLAGVRRRTLAVVRARWPVLTLGLAIMLGIQWVLFHLVMRDVGVTLPLVPLFAGYAVGRLASAVGVTPGGIGLTEVATTGALVAWGADPAAASAGAVLFAVVTNLMEVPIGGLAWLWWAVDPTGARRGGIAGTDDATGDVSG